MTTKRDGLTALEEENLRVARLWRAVAEKTETDRKRLARVSGVPGSGKSESEVGKGGERRRRTFGVGEKEKPPLERTGREKGEERGDGKGERPHGRPEDRSEARTRTRRKRDDEKRC